MVLRFVCLMLYWMIVGGLNISSWHSIPYGSIVEAFDFVSECAHKVVFKIIERNCMLFCALYMTDDASFAEHYLQLMLIAKTQIQSDVDCAAK